MLLLLAAMLANVLPYQGPPLPPCATVCMSTGQPPKRGQACVVAGTSACAPTVILASPTPTATP